MNDDSIYQDFKEHPEYPIEDSRRFTIKIKAHKFEKNGYTYNKPFSYMMERHTCWRCGYEENHRIHKV